jgi:hypothetical protein
MINNLKTQGDFKLKNKWKDEKNDDRLVAILLIIIAMIIILVGLITYTFYLKELIIVISVIILGISLQIGTVYSYYHFIKYKQHHVTFFEKYKNDYKKRQEYALAAFNEIKNNINYDLNPVKIPKSFSYSVCWSMIYCLSNDPSIQISLTGYNNSGFGIEDYGIEISQKNKSNSKTYYKFMKEIDSILFNFERRYHKHTN